MKNEFVLALNEVLDAKQLPRETVIEAIEVAMVSAYRKALNTSSAQQVIARLDQESGGIMIFAEKEVVEDIMDDRTEVLLEIAREVDPQAELGDMVIVDSTPDNFGRVAAQTARQVIQQRIREAERNIQTDYFSSQVGEVLNGIVQSTNPRQVTLGLDKRAEGIMPAKEQIRGERFRMHDRVRALLLEVKQTPRGPQIVLSRSHKNFLRRLLEDEVPEIFQGLVEVRSISREPGQRSKVAVSALQPGIDPVGACVGVRGVRIQAIVRELNDEKIDVIEWNPDPAEFISKALSPARVVGVYLDEFASGNKTATVVVPEDQLSLAIGRDGQNARLAAKLTTWRIDIKSLSEAVADAIQKLANNPEYVEIATNEAEVVPIVEITLAKKAEGRVIAPEEYKMMGAFLNRVEHKLLDQRTADLETELARKAEIRASVPNAAFELPVDDLENLSFRIKIALGGAGFSTVGDLAYQLELAPEVVQEVESIGEENMEELRTAVAGYLETARKQEDEEKEKQAAIAAAEAEVAAAEAKAAEAVTKEAEAQTATEEKVIAEEAETTQAEEAPDAETQPVAAAPAADAKVAVPEEKPVAAVEEPVAEEKPVAEEPAPVAKTKPRKLRGKPIRSAPASTEPSIDDIFAQAARKLGVTLPKEIEIETSEMDIQIVRAKKEEEEEEKNKKRKKRFSEVEYDPKHDVTLVKRKRKRGENEGFDLGDVDLDEVVDDSSAEDEVDADVTDAEADGIDANDTDIKADDIDTNDTGENDVETADIKTDDNDLE